MPGELDSECRISKYLIYRWRTEFPLFMHAKKTVMVSINGKRNTRVMQKLIHIQVISLMLVVVFFFSIILANSNPILVLSRSVTWWWCIKYFAIPLVFYVLQIESSPPSQGACKTEK